jgi:hypothetical protein
MNAHAEDADPVTRNPWLRQVHARPLIGYLFHCFMTGAWRGSV